MKSIKLPAKNNHPKFKKNITRLSWLILAFFVLPLSTWPITAGARTFNPNNIITDQEMFDQSSLSQTAIQKFLERENSVLAKFSQIINGKTMKAAQIIWEISQKQGVNPKFLLTTLEKEQALISREQATEKALDWATGYSCYGGGCKEKYRGFYNQLDAAAETQKIYAQKASQFSFRVGQVAKTYDQYEITPANQATANLYIYTPYVGYSPELGVTAPYGGNRLFWRIWHRYFSNQKFLDGQVVTDGTDYWLIQDNTKRKFDSKELFLKDYRANDAIKAARNELNNYPDGTPISFSNNTVVRSATSGQIYLLTENTKRPIIDNAALALLNDVQIAITTSQVPTISENKLNGYKLGDIISVNSIYPQGKLVRDETGARWWIQDGLKHEVYPEVWENRFNSREGEPISGQALEKFSNGKPALLKDGTFVLSADTGYYYLISQGARMRIQDLEIFDRVWGINKKNSAVRVRSALLEAHEAGEIIDYIDDTIKDSTVSNPTNNNSNDYTGSFEALKPESLILINGQSQNATITFKNTGSGSWSGDQIWLELTDQGKTTSSFTAQTKFSPNETAIGANQLASFDINLTAPADQSGLLTQTFTLYYNKNGTPTKIASISKFVIVKAGLSAQIVEQNIPVAVRNTWKPIQITMKIQNNSADNTWLAKKTALEIYNDDGSASYFYDPADWVRQEVAAVAVNQGYIKPGETGEFKFTLDPRGVKPGTYIMRFKLTLLDQNGKEVFLNGASAWRREIRVD
ncbi:MAG: hypothetical protein RB292_05210 [Patescibacteria group bacterium]|jgi:hypothetical protein|nr:hypothetical protein [Patescibacteria group bacterium]